MNRPRRLGRHNGPSACLAVATTIAALYSLSCARGDWVDSHPDIAERARSQPGTFVEQSRDQWAGLESLAGSYRVEISRGIGKRSLDLYVVAQRQRLLRVEVLSPAASSEGLLISGPEEVALWLAEEGRLYRGPAGSSSFARALGLDLTVENAVGALLGYGLGGGPATHEAAWDAEQRRIRVVAGERAVGWLHPVTLHFETLRFGRPGAETNVELADWDEEPAPVPRRITVEVPREDLRLQMRLAGSWTPNPVLVAETFLVLPIPGALELPLDELAREGGLLRRGLQQ